jgi:hypothetical protein
MLATLFDGWLKNISHLRYENKMPEPRIMHRMDSKFILEDKLKNFRTI